MAWNLVDEITSAAAAFAVVPPRRHFFVPLASIPIGQNSVRPVDRTKYSFTESYATLPAPDSRTSDVSLNISIEIPPGGLSDENGNPDPLIRLHVVDEARVYFEPAGAGMQDRLVIEMLTFVFLRTPLIRGVPMWFRRWEDARSIPMTLIYENVDRAYLQNLLNAVAAPVDASIANRVKPTNGLQFPAEVIQANKANFIAQFLAGAADHFIFAESGSVIGTAATDPANPARRLLKLHARYQDHTVPANPHPMNPRELFYLLFGDDSAEARNHPFLVRLNEFGQHNQPNVHPESKRMLLRPPLRTWKRVHWEADQEIANHQNNWAPAGILGADRFYNDHSRRVGAVIRRFRDGPYGGSNKCNLFTSDISIRAGFCACIHPVNPDNPAVDPNRYWHFNDANSCTNNIHRVAGVAARLPVTGAGDDADTVWAQKIENNLRAQPAADRQKSLNDAMKEEGRCFILAGARARRFVNHAIPGPPPVQGIANCAAALRRNGIGHIVLVREVLAQPQLTAVAGDGLDRVRVSTSEASGAGAVSRNFLAQLGGAGGAAAAGAGFIRLHLFELQPGGDPDTVQGLRSLNVQNVPRNLLGTADEAAADTRITHTPAGVPIPPAPAPHNRCCHDNHPPQGAAPTVTPC